jgi:hypothetical protein
MIHICSYFYSSIGLVHDIYQFDASREKAYTANETRVGSVVTGITSPVGRMGYAMPKAIRYVDENTRKAQ